MAVVYIDARGTVLSSSRLKSNWRCSSSSFFPFSHFFLYSSIANNAAAATTISTIEHRGATREEYPLMSSNVESGAFTEIRQLTLSRAEMYFSYHYDLSPLDFFR